MNSRTVLAAALLLIGVTSFCVAGGNKESHPSGTKNTGNSASDQSGTPKSADGATSGSGTGAAASGSSSEASANTSSKASGADAASANGNSDSTAAGSVGSSSSWLLATYAGPVDEVTKEINRLAKSESYVPVGLEFVPDEGLTVLLTKNSGFSISGWVIQEFTDLNKLTDDVGGIMEKGWLPVDISRTENGVSFLFLRTDEKSTGWQVALTGLSADAIRNTIKKYEGEGYGLSGISTFKGVFWLSFLKGPFFAARESRIETYSNQRASVESGVQANIAAGWSPSAVAEDAGVVYIAYTRPRR